MVTLEEMLDTNTTSETSQTIPNNNEFIDDALSKNNGQDSLETSSDGEGDNFVDFDTPTGDET